MDASSNLLVVRKSTAVRFPALVAAAWFGTFGASAAGLWMAASYLLCRGTVMGSSPQSFLPIAGMAVVAAAVSGLLVGGIILRRRLSPGYGALWGMLVVLLSHFLLAIEICVSFQPSNVSGFSVMMVTAFTAIAGGIVTFPVGAVAGYYLAKFREQEVRPSGCRLHGYRESDLPKMLEADS